LINARSISSGGGLSKHNSVKSTKRRSFSQEQTEDTENGNFNLFFKSACASMIFGVKKFVGGMSRRIGNHEEHEAHEEQI
jgi:hypothetical protein